MSIGGPSDRSNIQRVRQADGATATGPAGPASPSSKVFSLNTSRPAEEVAASAAPSSHGALVRRIRDRLAAGQTPDAVLRDEVGREVTLLVGRADPRIVEKVTQDVRNDPAISDMFSQLIRHASDNTVRPGNSL
ncbi:MAG: hypothetical protein GIKADHBN_03035 [Phycisphaerales bacterium]|nr:hypothetical protein [Phycisphaerales bacterium]